MSVGVQRLREEPDRIRQGAIDKREDPALVDPRHRGRTRARRRAPGESRPAQGGAQRRQQADRRGDPRRRRARRPGGRRPARRRAPTPATASTQIDAELAAAEAELEDLLLRIPNPADPEVPVGGEEANVTVRTWGEPLPARSPRRWQHLGARPHWELGEALDIIDNARGAKIAGSGFPVYKGAGLAPPARADLLVPRRPHQRARLHRGLAAGRREHGVRARDRPDPGQGGPDVRRHPRRPLPGPHRRGPGHQPPPRRDPRGGRAADPVRRLLAVLPPRGRGGRQGHPRHPPRPPVRQGRDGAVREARGQPGRPSSG